MLNKKNLGLIFMIIVSILFVGCETSEENQATDQTEEVQNQEITEESSEDETTSEAVETNDAETSDNEGDFSDLGTVKVGMDGETPGYTEVDKNGELTGLEVAVWEEIAERSGFEVEFVPAAFSSLFGMLDSERIDVVANCIGITDERSERYLFSEPYIYDENVLIAQAGKSIEGIQDLDGWSIAVEPASMDEDIVDRFEEENNITLERVFYDGLAIEDVVLGRVDLWLKAESGAMDVVNEYGEDKLQIISGTGIGDYIAYPFKDSDRGAKLKKAADKAILEMQEDGTLSEIANEYLPTDPTKMPGE